MIIKKNRVLLEMLLEHLQKYPISLHNTWFLARWEKIPLQQLLILSPKIYALYAESQSRGYTRIHRSIKGEKRINSMKGFQMQMYKRERIYKIG